MPHSDEPFFVEADGAEKGSNPFFGEWHRQFKFPPVPHTAKANRRDEFREKVQTKLGCNFYFTNEVHVEIILHIDAQSYKETNQGADLDNYAKCIIDCLKGKKGILIDDCQVQSLHVWWIDVYQDEAWFEVRVKGSPDEFIPRDIAMYEMPDGLWYPLSNHHWDKGEIKPINEQTTATGPLILEIMTDFSSKLRIIFRKSGMNRLKAYQESRKYATCAQGFHRSRIDNSIPMLPMSEWRATATQLIKHGGLCSKLLSLRLISIKRQRARELSTLEKIYKSKRSR